MIYIGDKKTKKCYLGDDSISRVYLGDELLFAKMSRLPAGYTEVEYISNPNLTCISAIPFANTTNRVEVDMKLGEDSASGNIAGAYFFEYWYATSGRHTRGSSNNRIYYNATEKQILVCGGRSTTSTSASWSREIPAPDGKFHVVLDYAKTLFQITTDTTTESQVTSGHGTYKMYSPSLFAAYQYSQTRYTAGGSTTTTNTPKSGVCNFYLYSYRVYESSADLTGNLIYDLVPCISPDKKVGLYDVINNKFYGSYVTTTDFVAGPVA